MKLPWFSKSGIPQEETEDSYEIGEPVNKITIEYDNDLEDIIITYDNDPDHGTKILTNMLSHLISGSLDKVMISLLEEYLDEIGEPDAMNDLKKSLVDELASTLIEKSDTDENSPVISPFGYR